MVKVGILSDTHLDRVTDSFKSVIKTIFSDTDIIIHAGDITGMEVHEYLSNWELKAVRGNMDSYALRTILPEKRIEVIEGKKIGVMHGSGAPFGLETLIFNQFHGVDIIIFGHSHIPFYARKGNTVMFNPGSFGKPYSPPGTVGMMEITNNEVMFRHIEVNIET